VPRTPEGARLRRPLDGTAARDPGPPLAGLLDLLGVSGDGSPAQRGDLVLPYLIGGM
jgi:hypothetical protein